METARKSLYNLILGIWIVAVPVTIVGMLLSDPPLKFLWGELIGSVVSTGFAFHIYHTLDIALDLDSDHAASRARQGSMIRSLVTMGVLLIGIFLREYISVIGIFTGLLGLKVSVYLQPLMEKIGGKGTKDRKE